jgi:CRP/FNR family transcriptional regulator, dissimilatory nitrate respiration regulator
MKAGAFLEFYRKSPLFSGIEDAEIQSLLQCLNARIKCFSKGEIIFLAGEKAMEIGLVLSGSVQIVKEDFWGNRSLIAHVPSGELFAEAYSCAGERKLEVSAIASEQSEIMLIDYMRVVTTCPSSCPFHARLIRNMMGILAEKNILLNHKIEHTSKRTTRDKLMSYLLEQAKTANSRRFVIPFDRQELADYLCVERSAMSSELGRMRDDGLLAYQKNRFELFETESD